MNKINNIVSSRYFIECSSILSKYDGIINGGIRERRRGWVDENLAIQGGNELFTLP
jgi:hypothetical protein